MRDRKYVCETAVLGLYGFKCVSLFEANPWLANHSTVKLFDCRFGYMVSHLFQNYDTIYVRFFATYNCYLS